MHTSGWEQHQKDLSNVSMGTLGMGRKLGTSAVTSPWFNHSCPYKGALKSFMDTAYEVVTVVIGVVIPILIFSFLRLLYRGFSHVCSMWVLLCYPDWLGIVCSLNRKPVIKLNLQPQTVSCTSLELWFNIFPIFLLFILDDFTQSFKVVCLIVLVGIFSKPQPVIFISEIFFFFCYRIHIW